MSRYYMRVWALFCFVVNCFLASNICASTIDQRCPLGHGAHGSSIRAGEKVVCLVDHVVADQYELWSVDPVVKLSQVVSRPNPPVGPLPFDVIRYAVSPDNSSVAYTFDDTQWTKYELWVVSISGGPQRKLSGSISFDFDVDDFVWSNRGDQLVFRYGRNASGVWDLYAVKASGGIRVKLNQQPVPNGAVQPEFVVRLGNVYYRCDCEQDEVIKDYEAKLPGTIFGDGFESGGVTKWQQ